MRILTIICFFLLSSSSFAGEVNHEGTIFETVEDTTELQCNNFNIEATNIYLTGLSLDPVTKKRIKNNHINEIPDGLTMGHLGDSYSINQSMVYISSSGPVNIPKPRILFQKYSKISPKRSYFSTPVKCVGDNAILVRMWGGGNCSSICEAYGLISFNEQGVVSSVKGLTYQEYIKFI